jgi:hypothetical protein
MIHVSVRVPSSSVFLRSVDGVIELGQDGRYTVVEHAIQSFEADHLAALDKLLQRNWFKRLWVLQEVAVSPNIQLLRGTESITWDVLPPSFHALEKNK